MDIRGAAVISYQCRSMHNSMGATGFDIRIGFPCCIHCDQRVDSDSSVVRGTRSTKSLFRVLLSGGQPKALEVRGSRLSQLPESILPAS